MKLAILAPAAALAAMATSATAQTGGLECRTNVAGRTVCEESLKARNERLGRENLDRLRESMASGPTPAEIAASRSRRLQKKVAGLIKAGKCDEAKAAALDAGDLTVADQVLRLCTPATAP